MKKLDSDKIALAMDATKMQWNVMRPLWGWTKERYSQGDTYQVYNVLDHFSFVSEIAELFLFPKTTKKYFEKELDSCAMYYFWSKAEHEIYVKDVFGGYTSKIDVYDQLKMNWKPFVNYVWSKRKKFVKEYNSCSK